MNLAGMVEYVTTLSGYVLAGLGGIGISLGGLAVFALTHPEKLEKWFSILLKLLSQLPGIFRGAHKQYVKHDLQGRVNSFVRGLAKQAPYLETRRLSLEWVDGEVTKRSFLQDDKVVIRLRRDDPHDLNFVHGAYAFVSTSLVGRAKRYISVSQRDAVDLFVTTKLIEAEKPQVVGFFLDEYLHPKVDAPDSKVGAYIDAFAKVDRRGLFFSMLLQELEFLGQKVFGRRKDQRIYEEVDGLVWFLEKVADRKVGDEGDLDFDREYCRFAIVIIGRSYNVTPSGEVWTRYIANKLTPSKIEVIYLLGSLDNREVIDAVAAAVCSTFEICRTHRMRAPIRYADDHEVQRDQYLVILRKRGVPLIQASA